MFCSCGVSLWPKTRRVRIAVEVRWSVSGNSLWSVGAEKREFPGPRGEGADAGIGEF